ncbi:serine hydrolase domain-containing protein [Companilactobacillus zhongbaensis]|uniref:serine hydrolase domain-containing protein n=1 Tax=Companilactobacillus zhongbaensis TaxID=2486009 RepID=UPI000F7A97B9|nr:serine hydrolase domain-containing protein [Companilactobacillus zhongbaensis]
MKKFYWKFAIAAFCLALVLIVGSLHHTAAQPVSGKATEKVAVGNTDVDKIDSLVKKNNFCGSIYVVKNGHVLYEKSAGYADFGRRVKNSKTTSYEIDSIQKNLTAGILMNLVQQGKVNLTDHLSKYFPNVKGADQITLRQMLDMESGLTLKGNGPTKVLADPQLVDADIANINFDHLMLNKWQYSPINFVLLARIIEKVTGETYKEAFTQTYIVPLNLKETTFAYGSDNDVNKAQGYTNKIPVSANLNYHNPFITTPFQTRDELGTGQVFMSPRDLFKVENYIVSGNLLTKQSRQTLFIPASISTYGGGFYNNHQSHSANGWGYGFQSVVHISDDGQTAVVIMSNYQRLAADIKPMASQIYTIAQQK